MKAALGDDSIEVSKHPPYSTYLAPSDLWLHSDIRDPLRGHKFALQSALGFTIYQWVEEQTLSFQLASWI